MKTRLGRFLAVVLLFCNILLLAACGAETPTDLWQDAAYTEDTTLGAGAKCLQVTVEAGEKTVRFTIHTDAETVGAALLEHGLIAGDAGEYGMYIKSVNGIRADYDKDRAYWAFYIGEDYALSGVDGTAIDESAAYRLVYTK